MRLYLIRHAHAEDAEDDAIRPLSARGRAQVRSLAEFLRGSAALQAEEIWHSGLVRAQQTAELFVGSLDSNARLVRMEGLCPEDDPRIMADRVQQRTVSVVLVGHEPHLSALASLLVTGTTSSARFVLKKAAVLALERGPDGSTDGTPVPPGAAAGWSVRWHISPELLTGLRQ